MKLFETLKDLAESGYVFRIQDNGGDSADRYMVAFCDGDYLAMSGAPTHPQGVSQWGEGLDPLYMQEAFEKSEAVDLAIGDLPPEIANHVLARINAAWVDFLGAVERREPSAVAPTRDTANENEGSHRSGGVGIYASGNDLHVRLDGEASEDRGPYSTAPEALQATLPQEYSLAGPEHHSSEAVSRLEPSADVAEKIRELEARVSAKDDARLGLN